MTLRLHLLTCLCALALAAPAQAQDPQVDPASPAGVEYQLPVDRARDEAGGASGGTEGSKGSASGEAPLFGEGVENNEATTPKKTTSSKAGTDSDPATVTEVEEDLGTSTPETVRAQVPSPDDGGGGLVAIAGGAGAVLLLGGLGGLAWRRRTTR